MYPLINNKVFTSTFDAFVAKDSPLFLKKTSIRVIIGKDVKMHTRRFCLEEERCVCLY